MTYICTVACYWEEVFWDVGAKVERPENSGAPPHFSPLTKKVAAGVPPTTENILPPDGSHGSHIRENLKELCGKNGILVKPETTVAWMHEQLKEKGITVQ